MLRSEAAADRLSSRSDQRARAHGVGARVAGGARVGASDDGFLFIVLFLVGGALVVAGMSSRKGWS